MMQNKIYRIKRMFALILGSVLCVYVLIPLLSAFFLSFLPMVRKEQVLSVFTIIEVMVFAISGFLMSLFISYFSMNREIKTTLLGVLMVIILQIFYLFLYYPILPRYSQINRADLLVNITLSTVLNLTFLMVLAIFGAWLVTKLRGVKKE